MFKRRLDQEGQPLADPVKHEVGEIEQVDNSTSSSTTQVTITVLVPFSNRVDTKFCAQSLGIDAYGTLH